VAQALSVTTTEASAASAAGPAVETTTEVTVAAMEDVTIRPIAPKPTLFVEPLEPVAEAQPAAAEPERPFIPPQAERPAVRAPRMPRVEDLPLPAQNQIRARQAEAAEAAQPQKPRVGLLQRLASVGLGRREEDEAEARPAPRPVAAERAAPPMPKAQQMPPLPRGESRTEPVSEYAKRPVAARPAPQGLDQHGRPAPVNSTLEDDQLEIPAFLRRQAH
jgi:cell division protein FtsZ